eukprot:c30570_g1_i1.p1 GENE.c30570_g1_i1~~c30570_g1_i1.p1  ORF type:complete len:188 (-),score=71.52 c30570_g1_i1:3-533(-)
MNRVICFVIALSLFSVCSGLALKGIEEQNKCSPLGTCSQCAVDEGCGWCGSLQVCMPGDVTGPVYGNCTQWNFNYCRDEPCRAYDGIGCGACVADPFCGWCESTSSCLEGTSISPLFASCENWQKDTCSLALPPALLYPMRLADKNATQVEDMKDLVNQVAKQNSLPVDEIIHQAA